jgi:DNA-binding NarL/FixJ family response regulator
MREKRPIRVLIVDDHPIVRDGLQGILAAHPDFEVVGQAANGAEAVRQAQALRPDVVLMDLRMPEVGGVEAIKLLRTHRPDTHILVLTTYDTDTEVLSALEAGATGYLLKDAPREDLIRAVKAAHRGESTLSPAVASRLVGRVRGSEAGALSPRELEIIKLIADGANNREAAAKLFISEATVKTHLLHIFEKLGVRDRAAAVAEAYRRRLIS